MAQLAIKPSIAFIGAAIGAAVFVLLSLLLPSIWILLLVYAAVVLLGYILGAATVGTGPGEFFRGLLIGTNAAVNWAIASLVFPAIFGPGAGTILAIAVPASPSSPPSARSRATGSTRACSGI